MRSEACKIGVDGDAAAAGVGDPVALPAVGDGDVVRPSAGAAGDRGQPAWPQPEVKARSAAVSG